MQPFQMDFFHLVIDIQGSSISFCGFIAHFFLALKDTPFSG